MNTINENLFNNILKSFFDFSTQIRLREAKYCISSKENSLLRIRNRQLASDCERLRNKKIADSKKTSAQQQKIELDVDEIKKQIASKVKELEDVQSQLTKLQKVHKLVLAERSGLQVSNTWLRKKNKELSERVFKLSNKSKPGRMKQKPAAPSKKKKRIGKGN